MMRLFIGLALKEQEKQYLKAVQDHLKPATLKGNFTRFDNFHLTFRYLGDTETDMFDALCDLLEKVAEDHRPFPIKFGGIGYYNRRATKLVYVDLREGGVSLKKLALAIEKAVINLGFNFEGKKFSPHITIAREVKFNQFVNLSLPFPFFPSVVEVDTLTLFESSRIHGILTYTPLFEAKLHHPKKEA